jgi:hypothetical protein
MAFGRIKLWAQLLFRQLHWLPAIQINKKDEMRSNPDILFFSCTGWQLHVNEGYTELPNQGVGDLLAGSFIDNPKGSLDESPKFFPPINKYSHFNLI